jgi:photosystem II stability/assembly factor-like uncharacterized protein
MKKILIFALTLPFLLSNCKKNNPIDNSVVESTTVISLVPFENSDLKIDFAAGSLPYNAKQFYFSNEANGICLTNDGELYTTKDKLTTWEKVYGSITDSIFVKDVKPIDALTYIVCGNTKNLGVLNGFISKTIDGGKTWTMVQKIQKSDIRKLTVSEEKEIYALSFSNDASRQTTNVLKSANLGQSWVVISELNNADGYNIYPISTSRLAIQTYQSGLLISNDQGKTWGNDVITKNFPISVNFKFGKGFGISGDENNKCELFKTANNGDTWEKTFSSKFFVNRNRINIVSPTTVFAFGTNNYYGETQQSNFVSHHIIYTLDATKTWKELDLQTCNNGFTINNFYDEKHGYIFDGTLYKVTIK